MTVKRKAKTNKTTVHSARGFRFGEVWLNSIKTGKGPAMRATNKPKLLKTAEEYKVRGIRSTMDQSKIVERIAASL